jgi:phospholipid-binding lipoprotein MlaA
MRTYFLATLLFASVPLTALDSLAQPVDVDENSGEISDPFEGVNRAIFWFNDKFDIYLAEPVAEVYDFVFPELVKDSVSNFFRNIETPVYLVSDIIQGKFDQVHLHTSRFLINSTAGIGGLFDFATGLGLEHHYEDFGTALAYHGVGDGPYIVIPFLGPSNLRDGLSRIVDRSLTPTTYIISSFSWHPDTEDAVLISTTGLEIISKRASLLEAVDSAKSASVDYYLFVRAAYKQSRDADIYDGVPPDDMDFEDE